MPTAKFRTKVKGAAISEDTNIILAESAAYLAYADQTDTFGLDGVIDSAIPGDVIEKTAWFDWRAPVANPEDIERIQREFDRLAKVERHECVTNPVNRKV